MDQCFSVVLKCLFFATMPILSLPSWRKERKHKILEVFVFKNVLKLFNKLSNLLINCIADNHWIHCCSVSFYHFCFGGLRRIRHFVEFIHKKQIWGSISLV